MIENIPKHIAIIMDGNGRWAKQHKLPRIMGHRAGIKAVKRTIKAASEEGIEIVTLYAFSSENRRRPKEEVDALMKLLKEFLQKEIDKLNKNNIKFMVIGRVEGLPVEVQKIVHNAVDLTKDNSGLSLVIALNYGGRSEIIDAVRKVASEVKDGIYQPDQIDESFFSRYLYTARIPDPDLLIRTSGELRVSNFLLWQISYSEIWVTQKLWPDFDKRDLKQAIVDFQKRERRFGGI